MVASLTTVVGSNVVELASDRRLGSAGRENSQTDVHLCHGCGVGDGLEHRLGDVQGVGNAGRR